MNAPLKLLTIPALAIDVGFFSTKFTLGRAIQDDKSEIKFDLIPSLAPRINGGLHSLPTAAELDGVLIEVEPGVSHFVGKDVYHTTNASGTRAVISNFSVSSAYKALFLGALYYVARHLGCNGGLAIKQLVLGLPLSTIYSHSAGLKTFAEGDHVIPNPALPGKTMRVNVHEALVVAQPQGALMNYGVDKLGSPSEHTTLVLDMGGGTFDWFVSNGMKPNHQRCGAAPIGALACAATICDQIHPELRHDAEIMARVDRALWDSTPTVKITGRDYTMADYMPAVKGVLHDAIEQMQKSVGSLRNVDAILLTGGGAKLRNSVIVDMLPEVSHLIEIDKDPVSSNVRGFHMIAEIYSS